MWYQHETLLCHFFIGLNCLDLCKLGSMRLKSNFSFMQYRRQLILKFFFQGDSQELPFNQGSALERCGLILDAVHFFCNIAFDYWTSTIISVFCTFRMEVVMELHKMQWLKSHHPWIHLKRICPQIQMLKQWLQNPFKQVGWTQFVCCSHSKASSVDALRPTSPYMLKVKTGRLWFFIFCKQVIAFGVYIIKCSHPYHFPGI